MNRTLILAASLAVILSALFFPPRALAHCDTMDGPVVADARLALETGNVTPVLKWVKQEYEAEVRQSFQRTLVVRRAGPEARELAEMYFFETVVRLHRAGEGEPYTGLKPAGGDPGPAVAAADKALAQGSPDALLQMLSGEAAAGLRARFARAAEARRHAQDTVEAGRTYVEAYVEFVHYAERLHLAATGAAAPKD